MSHDKVSSYDDEGLLKIPPYEEDEATMEASWEGGFDSSMLMDGFRTEDKRPKDRRIRAEKLSTYLLIGFLGIMLITLIPLSARKNRSNVGSDVSDAVKENTPRAPIADAHNIEPNTCVHCTGHRQGLTIDEWLSQGIDDSAALCDPEFVPEKEDNDIKKPVKVFILMGGANMVGAGQIHGNVEGALDYTVKRKHRFIHLTDVNMEWRQNPRVKYVSVHNEFEVYRDEWLGVKEAEAFFGPELQFGYVAGQIFDDAPVLIIKSASGHSSLGADLLPPGSRKFRVGDYVYAGYGDNPRRWPAGSNPANFRSSYSWYAGKEYDTQVSNIKKILREIGSYYPGASGYEISGFVWWHGDSDRRDAAYTAKYEENLAYLIQSLRADLAASEAKFVIATAGQRGMDAQGNQLRVAQAQIAVGSSNRNYPSLNGNVATVDIRSSWRGAYTPNGEYNIAHYGNNAETVMEAGNAMALAMAKLLQPDS